MAQEERRIRKDNVQFFQGALYSFIFTSAFYACLYFAFF